MRNYLTIGGNDSRNYGVYISGAGVFNSPARALNLVDIPGRNGAVILNAYERFDNIEVTYPAFIYSNFDANLANFRSLLSSSGNYRKITDSYHPNEYRLGVYVGGLDVTPTKRLEAGKFDIVFNCKPQRFLTSGDVVQTFTANGTINNPTRYSMGPLLRVYGVGTVGIGMGSITITAADEYTDIDCDLQIAYKGNASKNSVVSSATPDFPVFGPGNNGVTLGMGITRVDITPRWWTI